MRHTRRFTRARRGAALGTTAFCVLASVLAPMQASAGPKAPLVALDAGHGGRYPGAVNCRFSFAGKSCMLEADVNLAIAKKANRVLRGWGFRTRMTRRRDTTVNTPLRDIATWNATGGGSYRFYSDGVVDVHDDLQARVNVANCDRVRRTCRAGHRKQ